MHRSDDFPAIAGLFCAGMLVPVFITLLVQDTVSLYLTGRQFSYVAAASFGLVAWALLAVIGLDRRNFVFASVVIPWIVLFSVVPAAAIATQLEALEYLFWETEDLGAYAASFMGAGLVAVAADRGIERLETEYDWAPASQSVAVGALVLVVFAAVVGGSVLYVTATAASVSDVEPGVVGYSVSGDASLNVTVDGEPTELRLRTVTPDGTTHTERISYAAMTDGTATVPVAFERLGPQEQDPQAGTYEFELQSLAGLTVGEATYTVETPPPSVLAVETAPRHAELALEPQPDTSVSRSESDDEAWIGVVFAHQGNVADTFDIRVLAGDEEVVDQSLFVEPGRRGGSVFGLGDDAVERIRNRADGTATVEVSYGDQRVTAEVRLPEADAP